MLDVLGQKLEQVVKRMLRKMAPRRQDGSMDVTIDDLSDLLGLPLRVLLDDHTTRLSSGRGVGVLRGVCGCAPGTGRVAAKREARAPDLT